MATYDFKLNRDEVIKGALRVLGVISQGQTPDAAQVTDAAEALNILIKAWQSEGLPLWAIKTVSFTPNTGVTSYAVGTGLTIDTQEPLKIYDAWYRDMNSSTDTPITLVTQAQYDLLPNKSTTGVPVQMYYERLNGSGNIYLYLTPDAQFSAYNKIYFTFQRPFADFDTNSDYPDFPQEWIRALKYGLADEMSLEYGVNAKDRAEISARALMYREEALGFTQEEGSLLFQPRGDM